MSLTARPFNVGNALVALIVALVVLAIPAMASAETISGTVQDKTTGNAVPGGVCVYAATPDFSGPSGSGQVNTDGTYTVTLPGPGTYLLQFSGCQTYDQAFNPVAAGDYLAQWYVSGAGFPVANADQAAAGTVTVATSEDKTGVDLTIAKAAHITGALQDTAGAGAPDGQVCVSAQNAATQGAPGGNAFVAPDGSYDVKVPGGTSYKLYFMGCQFDDPVNNTSIPAGDYPQQWYQSGQSFPLTTRLESDASTVDVALAATNANTNAAIFKASHITGDVVDKLTGAAPTAGVCANATPTTFGQNMFGGSAVVQPDGSYDIAALSAGSYKVSFSGCEATVGGPVGDYPPQYLASGAGHPDAVASQSSGATITVATGATSQGNGAALNKAAHITGTVADVVSGNPITSGGICVQVTDADTQGGPSGSSHVKADGTFDVAFIGGDHMRLEFYGCADFDSQTNTTIPAADYYVQYYHAGVGTYPPAAAGVAAATPIATTPGASVQQNVGLAKAAHVQGTVTDRQGGSLSGGVCAQAFPVNPGVLSGQSANVAADG